MAFLADEARAAQELNDLCKEVVRETFDYGNWRKSQAKVKRDIHRSYLRFAEERGLNPYLCLNVFDCLENPDVDPIMIPRRKRVDTKTEM